MNTLAKVHLRIFWINNFKHENLDTATHFCIVGYKYVL